MPNRFTAVPSGAAPTPGRAMAPVVAVADLFMAAMLSRPGGLSLRSAWVTPGTLLLVALFTPVAVALSGLLLARGGLGSTVGAVLLLVVAAGSAAVAAVGLSQRRRLP